MKQCTKCKETKPTTAFYADRRRSDGLRSHCIGCHNAGAMKWKDEHREQDLKNKRRYMRQRRQDPIYREHEKLEWTRWSRANPEIWKANRQRNNIRAHRSTDPQALREYVAILHQDPCTYCGSYARPSLDHIVPRAQAGPHEWDNLTAACSTCNSSKRDCTLLVHLLNRPGLG